MRQRLARTRLEDQPTAAGVDLRGSPRTSRKNARAASGSSAYTSVCTALIMLDIVVTAASTGTVPLVSSADPSGGHESGCLQRLGGEAHRGTAAKNFRSSGAQSLTW